jgi:hypothetical protein
MTCVTLLARTCKFIIEDNVCIASSIVVTEASNSYFHSIADPPQPRILCFDQIWSLSSIHLTKWGGPGWLNELGSWIT